MKTLTPRQLQVLRFVRDYRNQHGYSPTMQEIGDELALSKVTAFEHVAALERKGALRRGARHSARSLQVCDDIELPEDRTGGVPLVGRIAAGTPLEAVENPETLSLDRMFHNASGDLFALEVTGESMIDEHIRDGDFVICQRRQTARDGETVVALLEDGEATLKTFYKEGNRIRLQPANPEFKPIYPNQCNVQGVVIGVVRKA
ncbi:MAG: transcriptional repressor LexA [Phycisphaerae bacterium]|nr:transcriptional repressor LexA [Phycisphaerae bacterium]